MAGERSSRAELVEIILADLYEQEIVPLKHPALIHYSPDQVRKALLKHLVGRCLATNDGEINLTGRLLLKK